MIESNNICMIAFRPLPKFFNRLKIAYALSSNGYKVDFICPIEKNQKNYENINGIDVFRVNFSFKKGSNYFQMLTDYLLFIAKCFKIINKLNKVKHYSYYHIHTPPDFLIVAAIAFKYFDKSKIILDLHDMLPEAVASNLCLNEKHPLVRIANHIERISIGLSENIICTNPCDKKIILSRNNINPNKIFIVMNTPDLRSFKIHQATKSYFGLDNKYILLFEGTIWKRRGIQTIIESLELMENKLNIYLLIVGDGPYLDELRVQVSNKGLENRVGFTGWVDPEVLSKYISIADVCIIPFLRTKVNERGVPNKLFEYIIHNKPIIAANLTGIASTFDDTEILFFEPGNPRDLKDKITWCYCNPTTVSEMVKNAKKEYNDKFTWDKMESELIKCYNS